jgi:serine/threonine protein phosphatase PrpC
MKVSFSFAEEQGDVRENMEDRILIDNFIASNGRDIQIFAVIDGHGGSDAAQYIKDNLTNHLKNNIDKTKKFRKAVIQTFHDLNSSIKGSSGATLSLYLIVTRENGKVMRYVANVGDSSIYGFKSDWKSRRISHDHKHNLKSERERLSNHKDYNGVDGEYVVHKNSSSMLAMSRAIGDNGFGDLITAEPYVARLNTDYEYVVLGSDGLWDVVSSKWVGKELEKVKSISYAASVLLKKRMNGYPQHDNTALIVIKHEL